MPHLTRRQAVAALSAASMLIATGAAAHDDQVLNVSGNYNAQGRNPDGSTYSGQVQIVQTGAALEMYWSIAGQSYSGRGQIDGRVLTVDWGASTPVIYVVVGNQLHGTWEGGTALEKLTPR